MRRLAKGAAELAAEVRLRETGNTCEHGDIERLAVARVDEVLRAEKMASRVRRGDHAASMAEP